ncbi:ankyrin repeat-containing domain protein [Aspergillus karnatakaensis]|uniref:ankyrin repeat domain-containing protein n=1 Tax=Aspergillus karnatakaensis TaxID=1810916 RepID=UPI003CCE488C
MILEYLRSKGCDINALNYQLQTPLDLAVSCRAPVTVMQSLRNLGAAAVELYDLAATGSVVEFTRTDNRLDVFERLEAGGSEELYTAEARKFRMLKLLSRAIKSGDISDCRRLKALGCPFSLPLPGNKRPPLIAALEAKQLGVVEWLLMNGNNEWVSALDEEGWDLGVIQLALRTSECNDQVLRSLMVHFEDSWPEWVTAQWSAVHEAVSQFNEKGLKTVLEFIVQLRQRHRNIPPLSTILNWDPEFAPVYPAAEHENISIIEILLRYGADIELRDDCGRTPLQWAVQNKAYHSISYLLAQGANVYSSDDFAMSPLDISLRDDDLQSIQLLLPYVRKSHRHSTGSGTPFSYCKSVTALALLLDNTFDPDMKDEVNDLHRAYEQRQPPLCCGLLSRSRCMCNFPCTRRRHKLRRTPIWHRTHGRLRTRSSSNGEISRPCGCTCEILQHGV